MCWHGDAVARPALEQAHRTADTNAVAQAPQGVVVGHMNGVLQQKQKRWELMLELSLFAVKPIGRGR